MSDGSKSLMIALREIARSARAARHWIPTVDSRRACVALCGLSLYLLAAPTHSQRALGQEVVFGDSVVPLEIAIGRSIPMTTPAALLRVSLADPEVADVVVLGERDVVLNALATGSTDLILWQTDGRRFHYRVNVRSRTDRKQVLLQVRIAEASRDFLREIGFSFLFQDQHTRAGTGAFTSAPPVNEPEIANVRDAGQFATLLSINEVMNLTGLLEAAEQSGRVKVLAEPNLIAADGEEAHFLAGGELPVPIAQPSTVAGVQAVTIQYREFGISLTFEPEILSEDLMKLRIEAEVSGLDFANAVTTSGFVVPAFRTRRTVTTVDLGNGQTLAIAGLLDFEETKIVTGIPLLKDIPILGLLFSSQRFERRETELLILVTPQIIDPMAPPPPPPLPGGEGSDGDGGGEEEEGGGG